MKHLSSKASAPKPPKQENIAASLLKIPEHFNPVQEIDVTNVMIDEFSKDLKAISYSDVIVVGAGISGLATCFEIIKLNKHLKVSSMMPKNNCTGT